MWCAVYSVQYLVCSVHVQIQGHLNLQVLCVIYTIQFAGCSVLPAKDDDLDFFNLKMHKNLRKVGIWIFQIKFHIGTSSVAWTMIVLGNPCINPYPEKCILPQIPITC